MQNLTGTSYEMGDVDYFIEIVTALEVRSNENISHVSVLHVEIVQVMIFVVYYVN